MSVQNIHAAGMSAPSIVQPLSPNGAGWVELQVPESVRAFGYATRAFAHREGFRALSAVEVAADKDGIDRGPEYHLSFSKEVAGFKVRCDTNETVWLLREFRLEGAEEDNHVPHGFVRNFWRAVAEPLIGMECACKEDEPAIRENEGDFVWRP